MSEAQPPPAEAAPAAPAAPSAPTSVAESEALPPVEIESFSDVDPAHRKFLYENPNPMLSTAFSAAEEKTGINRERLSYGFFGVMGLYLIVGSLAQLVCNMIGFVYPCYASVRAVRSESKDDDTHWLIYWCCFASFSIVDFFAERILSWFPIYWLVKTIFLIYLSAPQTRGAIRIYKKVVLPVFKKIDEVLDKYSGTAKAE